MHVFVPGTPIHCKMGVVSTFENKVLDFKKVVKSFLRNIWSYHVFLLKVLYGDFSFWPKRCKMILLSRGVLILLYIAVPVVDYSFINIIFVNNTIRCT